MRTAPPLRVGLVRPRGHAKGEYSSPPLPAYNEPGGLRQGPGRAVESLTSARPSGRGQSLQEWERAMTEHAVVIAGGGPTGLMLAGELALAGVDVAIVERRATPELIGSRARWPALTHHRGSRSARNRRSVPLAGTDISGRALPHDPVGHQRLSHPAQLRPRAAAEPHRAHPGRVGRRAGGDDLSRT